MEVSPNEFLIKCGRALTDKEQLGALAKYFLEKEKHDAGVDS